jgi:hypothetical protein
MINHRSAVGRLTGIAAKCRLAALMLGTSLGRWRQPTRRTVAMLVGALALLIAASGGAASSVVAAPPSGWAVVRVPRIAGSVELTGVTAFGPSDAWAVGYVTDADSIDTLTLHWDGTQWRRVPSPSPSADRNWLVDVSGSSPTDVWAVGSYWDEAHLRHTLAMRWDGTQWNVVKSPDVEGNDNLLNGVSVLSPSEAWAVGSSLDASFSGRTLVQRWDGTSWSIVPSPNPSEIGVGSNLLSVAAASSTDVWAVGDVDMGEFVMGTLAEHWDGTSWQAVTTPTVPEGALLDQVDVDGSGAAWAVGWQQAGDVLQPLAMRWTGAQWAMVDAPSFDGVVADFGGVAVLGPDDVWAVGGRDTRTLAAHWDGTKWVVTPTADPGRVANTLVDVAEAPGTNCLWAVGSYVIQGESKALIERQCQRAGRG